MRYYIVAGEASGDLHGSNLMKGLYQADPQADMRFWGGSLMDAVYKSHQTGRGLVRDYGAGAVIGFSQVLLHAGSFIGRLRACIEDIVAFNPDSVILIDYPGFNFRVAKAAHEKGFKVLYYIAPKVWASRESRVRKLKKYVDRLFIVFPFEKEYFTRKGLPFTYRGNPLIDAIDGSPALSEPRSDFFKRHALEDKPYIALLAGSRKGEVESMMPVCTAFAKALRRLDAYRDYRFIIAGAPSRKASDYGSRARLEEAGIDLVFGDTYGVIRNARAAVVNSGTASLETCLIGTPQVVAYAGSDFNYALAKQIIKVDLISLGNLIVGRRVFKELIQTYFTPDNLLSEVRRLMEDREYIERMQNGYAEIREALGGSGASAAVAAAMFEYLQGADS